jgi:cell division protein FtsQ
MDGRGRLLRSVNGPMTPAFAQAHLSAAPPSRGFRGRAFRRRFRFPVARLVARLPDGFGTFMTAALFAATIGLGVVRGGHHEAFVAKYGDPLHFAGRALGFGVARVHITGLGDLSPAEILAVGGIDASSSLPFLDVEDVRARLSAVPLVRDASVRKVYPGTVEISLVEREGHALWQNHGEFFVIAVDGAVIDRYRGNRFNELPIVVGEGAAQRAAEILARIDEVPGLKPHIRAAVLVSGRRWSLKLVNGVDVRLPEGDEAAALRRLAAMIRDHKVLDKDVLAIDLRLPDRAVLRLTEEAAAIRAEVLKGRAKAGKGNPT